MKGITLLIGAFIGLGISLVFKKKGIYPVLISLLSAFLFYKFRFIASSIFFVRTALSIILFLYTLILDTSDLKINHNIIKIMLVLLLIINFIIYSFSKVITLVISAILLYIIFFSLKKMGLKITKIELLGNADLLLIAFTGLYLNFLPGLKALLISLLLSLPLSFYMFKKKKNSRISYAPFILLALLLVDYYG